MSRFFIIGLIFLVFGINTSKAQQAYRMKLLSQYNDTLLPTVDGGDIWNDLTGWFDPIKNREYIIAGSTDSVYFFDVTDPLNMKLVDRELGTLRWTRNRDFETYQHYVYCVAEVGTGIGKLQVFDLQYLPDSAHKVYEEHTLLYNAHTIFIDTASARLYACSVRKPGGNSAMDIIDLSNPELPVLLAELEVPRDNNGTPIFNNVHEMYARNDTVYLSCESAGLFVFDLRDLSKQRLLTTITTYPDKGYNHSPWLDKSGRYVMFTDENPGLDIKIFDLQDFFDPRFVSQFNSNANAMPHNAYWYGDFAYVSSYHDGVRVWNVKDPKKPYQVAWYDTHPVEPEVYGGFKGCWGVYPYLPSGHIIASDLTAGIFLFEIDSLLLSEEEQLQSNLNITIFPNPSYGAFRVLGWDFPASEYTIFDAQGSLMQSGNLNEKEPEINLSQLGSGIYFIRLKADNASITKKLVKW